MFGWDEIVRQYRLRHGLSQERMAMLMGVSQRTVSRWERGDDNPSLAQQKRLRDLGWEPPGSLFGNLAPAIAHCPAPRALSRTERLRLVTLSKPALDKRPSIAGWIGRDMIEIACGVLQQMLDDKALQKAIQRKEIAAVVTTSRSVLKTVEAPLIGNYRTTVTYFFHEGTLYSDAISFPAAPDEPPGYRPIPMDGIAMAGLTSRNEPVSCKPA